MFVAIMSQDPTEEQIEEIISLVVQYMTQLYLLVLIALTISSGLFLSLSIIIASVH